MRIRDHAKKDLLSQLNQNLTVLVGFERQELVPVPLATGVEYSDIKTERRCQ